MLSPWFKASYDPALTPRRVSLAPFTLRMTPMSSPLAHGTTFWYHLFHYGDITPPLQTKELMSVRTAHF